MNEDLRPVNKLKGQINAGDMGPVALAIGIGIIIIAVMVVVTTELRATTLTPTLVSDETQNSTGSTPETLTANVVQFGVVSGSESVALFDFDTGTVLGLTRGTNYTVISYALGTFNMTTVPEANGTTDQYRMNYTYLASSSATTVIVSGIAALVVFSDFFAVIVIVAVSVIILALVMLLSRFSGQRGSA